MANRSLGGTVVYDVGAQYSTTTNPNGVWTYGFESDLGQPFYPFSALTHPTTDNGIWLDTWSTRYSSTAEPSALINYNPSPANGIGNSGASEWPAGAVWFVPGYRGDVDTYCTVRFTVPAGGDGSYDLAVLASPTTSPSVAGSNDFHIEIDGNESFGVYLSPTNSAAFTNTLSLAAGSTVDFMIGPGPANYSRGANLKLEATLTGPEPVAVAPTNPPPAFVTSTPIGSSLWIENWSSFSGSSQAGFNPSVFHTYGNDEASDWFAGAVWVDPGQPGYPDTYGVIRFTAPPGGDGTCALSTTAIPTSVWQSGTTDFHVVVNGKEAYGAFLAPGRWRRLHQQLHAGFWRGGGFCHRAW